MKAVVLLSGGLDSTVAMGMALRDGVECHPLAFSYGQRHERELRAANDVATFYRLALRLISVALPKVGSLMGEEDLPRDRAVDEIVNEIGSTYVPMRNLVFLSLAASYAEALGADAIVTGFNCNDRAGYPVPDGRPEFARAFELAALLGSKKGAETGKGIQVLTPLIDLTKAETIRVGQDIGAPMHLTWTCFEKGPSPCLRCDSCMIRADAFGQARLRDPALDRAPVVFF